MTAVFVHGNPETPAVWGPLRSELSRTDVVAVHLPGFGIPTPEGFSATKESYVDWLIAELETYDHPVDLVGHDWGGGLVGRVACLRPDLIRSWAIDVAGIDMQGELRIGLRVFVATADAGVAGQRGQLGERRIHLRRCTFEEPPATC